MREKIESHWRGGKYNLPTELKLETNTNAIAARDVFQVPNGNMVLITPPLTKDFWLWRVSLTEDQAVIAFPKFDTISCGFQIEHNSWNTNLPIAAPSDYIVRHIWRNVGDENIKPCVVAQAIDMLREAAIEAGAMTHEQVKRYQAMLKRRGGAA